MVLSSKVNNEVYDLTSFIDDQSIFIDHFIRLF